MPAFLIVHSACPDGRIDAYLQPPTLDIGGLRAPLDWGDVTLHVPAGDLPVTVFVTRTSGQVEGARITVRTPAGTGTRLTFVPPLQPGGQSMLRIDGQWPSDPSMHYYAARDARILARPAPVAAPAQPMSAPAAQPMSAPAAQPMSAPAAQPMSAPAGQPMQAPGAQPIHAPVPQPGQPLQPTSAISAPAAHVTPAAPGWQPSAQLPAAPSAQSPAAPSAQSPAAPTEPQPASPVPPVGPTPGSTAEVPPRPSAFGHQQGARVDPVQPSPVAPASQPAPSFGQRPPTVDRSAQTPPIPTPAEFHRLEQEAHDAQRRAYEAWQAQQVPQQPAAAGAHDGAPQPIELQGAAGLAAPGWYPDPFRRAETRWFDGRQWSSSVMRGGVRAVDQPG
ncbi:DUF2510 domain-containing protein [Agrococcus carbonis]|uniref:DUF2510 domain-containing protein n=1 Tax=Agrococcus carbonis TaxID=684552 RepID=A0A1H1N3F9_9MICO|nr:DUF2510 domain-containing protein [Agrococcus carbonis]SDR92719.1 Protein of unknown function [Agrococcus carbonis]